MLRHSDSEEENSIFGEEQQDDLLDLDRIADNKSLSQVTKQKQIGIKRETTSDKQEMILAIRAPYGSTIEVPCEA